MKNEMKMSISMSAYLAGLFDNVGSAGIYTRSITKHPFATISISSDYDKEYIETLKMRYGIGLIVKNNDLPVWRITGKDVDIFLEIVKSYVIRKAEQVSILQEFRETFTQKWRKANIPPPPPPKIIIVDGKKVKKKGKRGSRPISPITLAKRNALMYELREIKAEKNE